MKRFIIFQQKDGISTIVYDAIIPTNMIESHVLLYYTMYQTSDTAHSYYFDIHDTDKTEPEVSKWFN